MLDIGWTELVVIAVVLIIVVGPKDLPPMLRTFGKMMTKVRGMATDFRQQFDEALKEADLDDVRKTLSDAQKLNPAHSLREAMNPLRQMGNDIKADLQKATTPTPKPAEDSAPVEAGAQGSAPIGAPVEAGPQASVPIGAPAQAGIAPVPAPAEINAAAVVPTEQPKTDTVAAAAIASAAKQLERASVSDTPAEPKAKRAVKAKPLAADGSAPVEAVAKKAVKTAEKPTKTSKKKGDA